MNQFSQALPSTDGDRRVKLAVRILPIAPERYNSRAWRYSGQARMHMPTLKNPGERRTASAIASISSRLRHNGFSQKTCLPAAKAART